MSVVHQAALSVRVTLVVRIQTPQHSIRMKLMARILSSLLALVGVTGCQPSAQDDARPIKDVIEEYKDAPLGTSINAVSHKLASSEIILPTEGTYENGKPFRLKVASDNQGREWAYAYTDESELLAAFPGGCPFVAMQFRDAFKIVDRDSRFGGIFINHTDKYKYLIPREVFDDVNVALAATSGNETKAEQ